LRWPSHPAGDRVFANDARSALRTSRGGRRRRGVPADQRAAGDAGDGQAGCARGDRRTTAGTLGLSGGSGTFELKAAIAAKVAAGRVSVATSTKATPLAFASPEATGAIIIAAAAQELARMSHCLPLPPGTSAPWDVLAPARLSSSFKSPHVPNGTLRAAFRMSGTG